MIQFKLFRIPISIHWMFFLLTAFLGGGLRADETSEVHLVLVFMIAAFISILIHELGHALTGLRSGAPQTSIQLHGMGGLAQFPGARFTRKENILTTAAGPAASILLAISFIAISRIVYPTLDPSSYLSFLVAFFISTMIRINIFWSIINLCPVLPLDGGQILRDVLGPNRIKLTCIIGFITLAILGIALWIYTQSIYNMILIALLGNYTWKLWQGTTKN